MERGNKLLLCLLCFYVFTFNVKFYIICVGGIVVLFDRKRIYGLRLGVKVVE